MSDTSSPSPSPSPTSAAAKAAADLARLQLKVEEARKLQAQLLQDAMRAVAPLDAAQAAVLLEVNEELIIAALRSQSEAVAVALALDDALQSTDLDALTHLPSRRLLHDRFNRALAAAQRHHSRLALLFLDINHFKQINDSQGHAVGDAVLLRVASLLVASVRAVDTVCRYGGDEFVILLTEISQPDDAARVAQKLAAALAVPALVGDRLMPLSASIGISLYPEDGLDSDTLIGRADIAMYQAKRHGLGSFAFHGRPPNGQRPVLSPTESAQAQLAAEHDERFSMMRETNEQLVLAILAAQRTLADAEHAQRQQGDALRAVLDQPAEEALKLARLQALLNPHQL